MAQMMHASILDEALRLASLGYRVFPLTPRSKQPLAGSRGVHDATSDPDTIRAWWRTHPDANIGLACGGGLLVIDVDPDAMEAYGAERVAELELEWIAKPRSRTPRRGFHLFMQSRGEVRNSAGRIGVGLDLKSTGGYVVVPPSRVVDLQKRIDGAYEWIEPLTCGPAELPPCPEWLVHRLHEIEHNPTNTNNGYVTPTDHEAIPEGRRNDALASIAGHLRSIGLNPSAIAAALHEVNTQRCTPPLESHEVDRIAASIGRYEPRMDLAITSGVDLTPFVDIPPSPTTDAPASSMMEIGALVHAYPALRKPVIHGLLREGETMNIIAPPKTGKSWLTLDLAISIATSRAWLGRYATEPGNVLIIDNELHRETSAHRVPQVADARGVSMREIKKRIYIDNVRGRYMDINRFAVYTGELEPGRFKLIVLDAFYRFMPAGGDENDNALMTNIYNVIDSCADHLGCCFVLIHHSTKGNQSGKSVTDVGAGAGAQSRASDTHLVLRPHEEEGAVILDAAVRSWPPIDPVCLRWECPVWSVDESLDPSALRNLRKQKQDLPDEPEAEPWTPDRFVARFISEKPLGKGQIREAATAEPGLSWRRVADLLEVAEANGLVHRWRVGKAHKAMYATVPPSAQGEVYE